MKRANLQFYSAICLALQACTAATALAQTVHYSHELANPLEDVTANAFDATNGGAVTFGAPLTPGVFQLGTTAGIYNRAGNAYLTAPNSFYGGGDFTYVGMVRKNNDESGGHQTILSTNRFRFQFQNTDGGANGFGSLRLDVNGAGASGGLTANNTWAVDEWYFVALSYSDTTKSIQTYMQDASPLFNAPAFTGNAGGVGLGNMNAFRVGSDGLSGIGGGDSFGGQIDGSRFYNTALTSRQLRDVFRQHNPNSGPGGAVGMVAQYTHEGGTPLSDNTGHNLNATNAGGVTFVAPPAPGPFQLGTSVGEYDRGATDYLSVPAGVYFPQDDFSFVAMVQKNADETGGHQTILASDRFRFQFRNTGSTADGLGTLRLDLNGGVSGSGESGDGTFATDEWQFVALTYNATTKGITAWMHGESPVLLGPAISTTSSGIGLDNMTNFRIGGDGVSGIGGFDGWGGFIEGAQFYDHALTKRELRDIYRTFNPLATANVGLVAHVNHDTPNPLTDVTGNGANFTNAGGVAFTAPAAPTNFEHGGTVGEYTRSLGNSYLNVPNVHTPGDDFTFTALVRKNSDETGGHQTILGSDRFRLQFSNSGGLDDGGVLRLDINGTGASGPANTADGTFLTDEWYFVAMRYDASTNEVDLFLAEDEADLLGSPDFTRIANGAVGLDDMAQFRIGADGLSGIGSLDAFGGQIDDLRFFDIALTDAELQELFASLQLAQVPEPASLVLWSLLGGVAICVAARRGKKFASLAGRCSRLGVRAPR